GERWTGDKCIRQGMWAPALRKAGVRYRKPYQTRHTYASMMLMAGEHVMWVAKQMGHTDWSLTPKRYSRWITSDMPDAGQKAVRLWSQLGHNTAVTDSKGKRRGGDSNPRHGFCPCNCLAGSPVRPLHHLAVVDRVAPPRRNLPIIRECGCHHNSLRFRLSSRMKNGPPTRAVITPTGISAGAKCVRESVSQITRKAEPRKKDAGISVR